MNGLHVGLHVGLNDRIVVLNSGREMREPCVLVRLYRPELDHDLVLAKSMSGDQVLLPVPCIPPLDLSANTKSFRQHLGIRCCGHFCRGKHDRDMIMREVIDQSLFHLLACYVHLFCNSARCTANRKPS